MSLGHPFPASVFQPNRIGALRIMYPSALVWGGAEHAIQIVSVETIVAIIVLEELKIVFVQEYIDFILNLIGCI